MLHDILFLPMTVLYRIFLKMCADVVVSHCRVMLHAVLHNKDVLIIYLIQLGHTDSSAESLSIRCVCKNNKDDHITVK